MSDMHFEDKQWLEIKEQYLKQVEDALADSGQPGIDAIINDVRSHLDRRFAELPPLMRTWENYQKIITEMGPPSDYAELAGGKNVHACKKVSMTFVVTLAIILTLLTAGLIVLPALLPRSHIPTWTDKMKTAFTADPEIVGKWVSVDIVKEPNEFYPGSKLYRKDLFLKDAEFGPDGTTNRGWSWTGDWIIDNDSDVKAEYEIRNINGTAYLFLPWLSGDVTIRHQKPEYYVLKKVSQETEQLRPENEKATTAAIEAAESWLKLVDDGAYAQSWTESAEYFRNNVTMDKWEQAIEPVRKPLGKTLSRKPAGSSYTTRLPGAPDGQYVVIRFETSFENKKNAVETVTPMLDSDGQWRVSGYYIK